ncbi:MAG: hypothetical protein V1853_04070 [bacterium]
MHKIKKYLPLIIIAAIPLCGIALGFYYSSLPEHHPQRDRQSCESVGGEWSNEHNSCLLANKAAGEICTDGGQCQSGVCFPSALTEGQQAALSSGEVSGITGTCYPEELVEGCVKQVILGTVSKESLCLDN